MKKITAVLVGQPNVGKSSLINTLCKSSLRVGNFSGVTIEKASAKITHKNYEIEFIDLPGTYALDGYSQEEIITQNYLKENAYDVIINVLDATNLRRNLILTTQLIQTQKKMIIALNMSDEAKDEGFDINVEKLASLSARPSINISAKTGLNLGVLLDLVIKTHINQSVPKQREFNQNIEEQVLKISQFLSKFSENIIEPLPKNEALNLLKGGIEIKDILSKFKLDLNAQNELKNIINQAKVKLKFDDLSVYDEKLCDTNFQAASKIEVSARELDFVFKSDEVRFASEIYDKVCSKLNFKQSLSYKLDKILIHKVFGLPIFLCFMWILFWLTFNLGQLPMDYIELGFSTLSEYVKSLISNETLANAISDGAISGVGAVLVFLPNIIILFIGIALLETTGYMARVAFLLDGILHKFGLHGKSFIPLITGFGCSVPAFMATRMLKSKKDKLLTLYIINFMSCGARLPVYVLFIGIFFEGSKATNVLFGVYLLGALLGLLAAKILAQTAFRGHNEPFIMEMPKYRVPNFNVVFQMVYNKAKMYVKKAGTFILAASLVIWFASNYPKNEANLNENLSENLVLNENLKDFVLNDENKTLNESLSEEAKEAKVLLENSYLGMLGNAIKPAFAPLGFDEKLSIALISGLAAKEVMISTLGVLFGNEDEESLRMILKAQIPFSVAVSFVLFVMIYNPCFAATIVFNRESGHFKYTIYLFIFTCSVAYFMAFIGYNLSKFLGLN